MNLNEWVPIRAIEYAAEISGEVITAEDWNKRLLLTISQGNNAQEVLVELVARHLELRTAYDALVQGEINLILPGQVPFESVYGIQSAIDLSIAAYSSDVVEAFALKSNVGHGHAQSEIADLQARLEAIDDAIELAQQPEAPAAHSSLAGLTGQDCHPISSITGLTSALSAKQKTITVSTAAPSGGVDGDMWVQYA